MSNTRTIVVSRGSSMIGLLGIVLVIAKLGGIAPVVDWSWWLVLLPFYAGFVILLAFLAIPVVLAILAGIAYGGFRLYVKAVGPYKRRQSQKRIMAAAATHRERKGF